MPLPSTLAWFLFLSLVRTDPVPRTSTSGSIAELELRVSTAEARSDSREIVALSDALGRLHAARGSLDVSRSWFDSMESAAWACADLRSIARSRLARAELCARSKDEANRGAELDELSEGWLGLASPEVRFEGRLLRARVALAAGDPAKASDERRLAFAEARCRDAGATVDHCVELADVALAAGDMDLHEEVLQTAIRTLRGTGDRNRLARVLAQRGLALQLASDYREALRTYQEAFDLQPDQDEIASILGALSALKETLGDLEGALADLGAAQAHAKALGKTENTGRFATLESNLLFKSGDVAGGLAAARRAVDWNERSGERRELAESLTALANCLDSLGRYEELRSISARLITLAKDLGSDALGSTAYYYSAMCAPIAERMELVEKSIDLARRAGHGESVATALGLRAWFLCEDKRFGEAIEDAQRSAELLDDLRLESNALRVLDTAVVAALDSGDWHRADRLISVVTRRLEESTLGMGARPATTDLAVAFGFFELTSQDLVALRVRANADPEAAIRDGFRRVGLFRSRSLLAAMLGRRADSDPEAEARTESELQAAQQRWNAAITALAAARGQPDAELEARFLEVRTARRQHELALSRRMDEVRANLRAYDPFRTSVEDARSLLPGPNSSLIVFAEGRENLYAYGQREGRLVFVDLGAKAPLTAVVTRVRATLAPTAAGEDTQQIFATRGDLDRACEELHERLTRPVLAKLGEGVDRLTIVPSPMLQGFSFDALVVGREPPEPQASVQPAGASSLAVAGRAVYFLERYSTSYLPSVPTGIELARTSHEAKSVHPALVLGDPAFTFAVPASSARGAERHYERLPKAREEAVDVASRLEDGQGNERDARAADRLDRIRRGKGADPDGPWKSERVELRVGEKATRSAFLELAPAARLLHVATHGVFVADDWNSTGLVFAPDTEGRALLTLNDILDMRLEAQIAVLAACDTGIGDPILTEGPISMAWAFLHAGAHGVVASLWKADDAAAHDAMVAFYEGLLERGESTSVALRNAKLGILRSKDRGLGTPSREVLNGESPQSHPRLWAPFAYFGSGN